MTGASRLATCRCGQLSATCTGAPMRVSVCHCLDCKKRSGSAFAYQARWPEDQVAISGDSRLWSTRGESGHLATFRFCVQCGGTIAYTTGGMPGLIAIPVGTFAEPSFPPPEYSVYEERMHDWIAMTGDGIEHFD